jgi:hypothetical protein
VDAPRHGRPYRRAVAAVKARGAVQVCGRRESPNCPNVIYAARPKGHRESITLGHIRGWDETAALPHAERLRLFLDPANHRPECPACNFADGGRQSLANQRGVGRTPTPARKSYRNPRW